MTTSNIVFKYDRFVGNTDFAAETIIGLELNKWSANGNDGSVHGKR